METEISNSNGLFLDTRSIKELYKINPKKKVGVNKGIIYCQIARYSSNPKKRNEMLILCKVVEKSKPNVYYEPRYSIMSCEEILKCFDNQLNILPRTSFVNFEKVKSIG